MASARKTVLLLFLPVVLLAACVIQSPPYRPWAYGDLRALDPPDAATPSTDIIALYTRRNPIEFQIRIDLLDLTFEDDYSIHIHLFDNRDYLQRPLEITIPAGGTVRVDTPAGGKFPPLPRAVRDPALDTVTVSLNPVFLGDDIYLSVYTYTADASEPADEIVGVRADDLPPARAPLLVAFYDTYPAATPAQALRRWDGAHTGPTGGRHGLKYILDNAETYGIPVALLDFKTPQSLAAFHYLNSLSQIQRLLDRRLLILPDVAYGEPADISLGFSRRAASDFGLPASPFLYAPFSDMEPASLARFVSLPDPNHIGRDHSGRLIPLPDFSLNVQVTRDAFSLDVRRALIETALSPESSDLVVLGGSLPNSTWGAADMAGPSFAWIAAHPWIWALKGEDLLTFPVKDVGKLPAGVGVENYAIYATDGEPTSLNSAGLQATVLSDLRLAPHSPITDSAWQTYLLLTNPDGDAALQSLRAQYLGQIGILLAASRWAEKPYILTSCSGDFDYDEQEECLLANSDFFSVVELDGARLTHLFWRDENGAVHQMVGPTAQFTVGLSDSSLWKVERGVGADPSQVMGAFSDADAPFIPYVFTALDANALTLTRVDGRRIKSFQLTPDALGVSYQSAGAVTTQVPLVVDPQTFFFGAAEYEGSLELHGWQWGLSGGPRLEVHTDAPFVGQDFMASAQSLSSPENPNWEYPAGHYYPFPFSIVTVNGQGDFTIIIASISQ